MAHRNDNHNPCRNWNHPWTPAPGRVVTSEPCRNHGWDWDAKVPTHREYEPCRNHAQDDFDAWADAAARDYEDEQVGRWDATGREGSQRAAGRHHDDEAYERVATPEEIAAAFEQANR